MTQQEMTYASVGVVYGDMDPFKILAQRLARQTNRNVVRRGRTPVEWTRGESVFVYQDTNSGRYYGHVEEGLGTKNLVADALAEELGGAAYYDYIAKDTVAMIVNDLITLGILPDVVAMHLAVGDSGWFKNEARCVSLLQGWRDACNEASAMWSGGETPTLKGVVEPHAAVLAGSAHGHASELFDPTTIQDGDHIIGFASSGIHANGLTLARAIADKLPEGYLTKLASGKMYGSALLVPTHIYVRAVEYIKDVLNAKIRYGINVTGHGWRKLMRSDGAFEYRMDAEVPVPEVLSFMQKEANISDKEAYGNLNMGLGFALIVAPEDSQRILEDQTVQQQPFRVFRAGTVRTSPHKKVEIPWKGLTFKEDELQVR